MKTKKENFMWNKLNVEETVQRNCCELKLRVLGICAGQKSFVKLKTRHFDGASSSSVVLKKLSAQCFLINYCFSAFLQTLFEHIPDILKEFYVEGKISIYFI